MPWKVKHEARERIPFSSMSLGSMPRRCTYYATTIASAIFLLPHAPLCVSYRVRLRLLVLAPRQVILHGSTISGHVIACINSAVLSICATFWHKEEWTSHLPRSACKAGERPRHIGVKFVFVLCDLQDQKTI